MGQDGHLGCALDSLGFPQHVHYFPRYSGMGWTLGIWCIVHGTGWDSHSVSNYFPGYSGMGWTLGIWGVVHGTPWDSPHWDGMDTWDWGYCAWDSLGFPQFVHSNPQYSGMGWNGHHWDSSRVCPLLPTVQWDGMEWTPLGFPQCHSVHCFPRYSGMEWNGHHRDSPSVSIASHGTVGLDGVDIIGIPPVCPLYLPWWYSGMGWTSVRQWRMSQEH